MYYYSTVKPADRILRRPPYQQIEGILFDFDGTLIDSSSGIVEAVQHALRALGAKEPPLEEILQMIGYPLAALFSRYTSEPSARCYELFRQRADETVVAAATALVGAESTLKELSSAGFRLAIVSTKSHAHIADTLRKLSWESFFPVIIGSDDVTRIKPDPEPVIRGMLELSLERHQVIMVGDTENDIRAAHDAGVWSVGVRSPYGGDSRLLGASPDWLIDRIDLLSPLLLDSYHRTA